MLITYECATMQSAAKATANSRTIGLTSNWDWPGSQWGRRHARTYPQVGKIRQLGCRDGRLNEAAQRRTLRVILFGRATAIPLTSTRSAKSPIRLRIALLLYYVAQSRLNTQ